MLRRCLWSASRHLSGRLQQPVPHRCLAVDYKSQYSYDKIYPNSNHDFASNPLSTAPQSTDEEFSGYIPVEKLQIQYTRSSGPGGQHVNKVNSKVEIRFHVSSADWIPAWIRSNILTKERNRITKEGFLIVSSDKTRKQMLNQADCMYKIRTIIFDAAQKEAEPSEEEILVHEKRKDKMRREMLRQKRSHSLKKQSRGKVGSDAY